MSGLGVLSLAWVEAEAAMPLGWRLIALVRQTGSDDWLATAAGPLDGQAVHGRGSQPDQAYWVNLGVHHRDQDDDPEDAENAPQDLHPGRQSLFCLGATHD
jgi:hypothetical protein